MPTSTVSTSLASSISAIRIECARFGARGEPAFVIAMVAGARREGITKCYGRVVSLDDVEWSSIDGRERPSTRMWSVYSVEENFNKEDHGGTQRVPLGK